MYTKTINCIYIFFWIRKCTLINVASHTVHFTCSAMKIENSFAITSLINHSFDLQTSEFQNLTLELHEVGGRSLTSRVPACSNRQCGCKEFSMFMLMACWWLGGPPRKLSWGLVAAAMAAKRGGAPPPPNRAKEGGSKGRADSRSFSISASCKRFAFARRFWNQIFTCNEIGKFDFRFCIELHYLSYVFSTVVIHIFVIVCIFITNFRLRADFDEAGSAGTGCCRDITTTVRNHLTPQMGRI